jgi:hypothetical protein
VQQNKKDMNQYTYKNEKTNETKEIISTLSFVLADEYFECKYYYLNSEWKTVKL